MDIVNLLRDYAVLLEKSGMAKDNTQIKIMFSAAEEISRLRKSLEFQTKLAEDNNKERLTYMDWNINARNAYESLCKDIREMSVEDWVCGMCKYDCDHGLDGYANECPGFERDDCFELDSEKWYGLVRGEYSEKNR